MLERIVRFLKSGEDPNGYYVSASTLLEVIGGVGDVSETTRNNVTLAIHDLIIAGDFVDSLQLGITFGNLLAEASDFQGILRIVRDVKNLEKVPIVNIRGKRVI